MTYSFFLAELTTGNIVADVKLATFSGARHLLGGALSATMDWSDLPLNQCAELQEMTTPAKYTVVAERNGLVAGEWIIWKRSRDRKGPISLIGAELISFMNQRPTNAYNFVAKDQLVIANALADNGLNQMTGLNVVLPSAPVSGVIRDRKYQTSEAKVGQRMRELAEVVDGFDYYIDTTWATTPGQRRIVRTMKYFSPRAGQDRPYILGGKSILGLHVDEDGTLLASGTWAIGAGEGPDRLLSHAENTILTGQGFPYMNNMQSWTSVKTQSVLDGHAEALLEISQSAELPPQLTVAADADPQFGTYDLGDRMVTSIEPTSNFPTGYSSPIRILGWTLAPPAVGVEFIALDITANPGGGA